MMKIAAVCLTRRYFFSFLLEVRLGQCSIIT